MTLTQLLWPLLCLAAFLIEPDIGHGGRKP